MTARVTKGSADATHTVGAVLSFCGSWSRRTCRLSTVEQRSEVVAVPAGCKRVGALEHRLVVDEPHPPGDLLGRADLEALPLLDRLDEAAGRDQRLHGPGVEPRRAARHQL